MRKVHFLPLLVILPLFSLASCGEKNIYKAVTIQPFWDESSAITDPSYPEGTNGATIIAKAVQDLTKTDKVTYDTKDTLKGNITKETIQNLGENQIILFQGHGEYGEYTFLNSHSLLHTGAVYDDSKESDPEYKDDVNNGRIYKWIVGMGQDPVEVISYKFIDKYCPSIKNSIVYLGQCESCHEELYEDPKGIDDTLVQSFLNKGAAVVIANTQSISQKYGNLMEYKTISLLSEINPDTNKKYTIGEALSQAKSLYGEKDPYLNNAVVTLFGNSNFSLN